MTNLSPDRDDAAAWLSEEEMKEGFVGLFDGKDW